MNLSSRPPGERRDASRHRAESGEGSLLGCFSADEGQRSHKETSEGRVERDLASLMADVPQDYVWSPLSELDL